MIWVTGSVAIALMLTILAISPNQILSLHIVNTHYYIWASYLLLSLCALCALIAFLTKNLAHTTSNLHIHLHPQASFHSQKINAVIAISRQYLTPLYYLRQQGKLSLILRVMTVLLFWVAVICHTLAQRVDAVQAMPPQPIYIDALVTPTQLSDKRLVVKRAQNESANAKKTSVNTDVTQGYRQLVTLSSIRPYHQYEIDKRTDNPTTDNPFADSLAGAGHASQLNGLDSNRQVSHHLASKRRDAKPMTVMLYSYRADSEWLNNLAPNQQVRMRLKLRPLDTESAEDEFDEYRWLSTRHATAIAEIIDANPKRIVTSQKLNLWQRINTYRYRLREHFLQSRLFIGNYTAHTGNYHQESFYKDSISQADNDTRLNNAEHPSANNKQDAAAVTLSLLTGDRSLISTEMTGLYRFAGISHLLAISGAHVLFLAILSATLASLLTDIFYPRLYQVLPRWQLRFIVAVSVAFIYAMFAGFDVPAMRTAWMLIVVGVGRYLLATPSIFKILLILAIALAWQDIFVLWQAGYWLSFIAVTVLIIYSQRFSYHANTHSNTYSNLHSNIASLSANNVNLSVTKAQKVKHVMMDFLKLQLWMSVALLPISLWLFGKVSLWGFIVNIFAIGFFGWVIVPLDLLAGLTYMLSTSMADIIWSFVTWLLSLFHGLLGVLQVSASQVGWIHTDISLSVLLLLFLGALPFVLPKGMISRYLSLPALLAVSIVSFAGDTTHQNQTQIIIIDTANSNISATLISEGDNHWLLLSAYLDKYESDVPLLNSKQASQFIQHLYDSLKQNDVGVLTGVIVQTATPEMAGIVASLREALTISYYWQAGLKSNQIEITRQMQGIGLTAQSCVPSKQWLSSNEKGNHQNKSALTIQAVTGWQKIDDVIVHDCAIRVSSTNPVVLINGTQEVSLLPTQSISPTAKNTKLSTDIILYSSSHSRVSKLWALMCLDSVLDRHNSDLADTTTLINHHWVVTAQSSMDKTLLEVMQPQSFEIVGNDNGKINESLQALQLQWEQGIEKTPVNKRQ